MSGVGDLRANVLSFDGTQKFLAHSRAGDGHALCRDGGPFRLLVVGGPSARYRWPPLADELLRATELRNLVTGDEIKGVARILS